MWRNFGAIVIFRATTRDPMPKQVAKKDLDAIVTAIARFPERASVEDIHSAIDQRLPSSASTTTISSNATR
jgi:hypothetical protein